MLLLLTYLCSIRYTDALVLNKCCNIVRDDVVYNCCVNVTYSNITHIQTQYLIMSCNSSGPCYRELCICDDTNVPQKTWVHTFFIVFAAFSIVYLIILIRRVRERKNSQLKNVEKNNVIN